MRGRAKHRLTTPESYVAPDGLKAAVSEHFRIRAIKVCTYTHIMRSAWGEILAARRYGWYRLD